MFRLAKLRRRSRLLIAKKDFRAWLSLMVVGAVLVTGWLVFQPSDLDVAKQTIARIGVTVGFKIKQIQLNGVSKDRIDQIYEILNITDYNSTLTFDVEQSRKRLEDERWVMAAGVRKFYPDRLEVDVVERRPFAIWQRNGKVVIIDQDGVVIDDFKPDKHSKLPLVMGEGAQKYARELFSSFVGFARLRQRLAAASFIGQRRWTLIMDNDVKVLFPEQDITNSLRRLQRLEKTYSIFEREVRTVDLRFKNKVVLRLTPKGYDDHRARWRQKLSAALRSNDG